MNKLNLWQVSLKKKKREDTNRMKKIVKIKTIVLKTELLNFLKTTKCQKYIRMNEKY